MSARNLLLLGVGGGSAAAPAAFSTVAFDGTADYLLRGAALTGEADGPTGTFAARIHKDTDDTALMILFRNAVTRVSIFINIANTVHVELKNPSGTTLVNITTTTEIFNADGMADLLVAWDLTTSAAEVLQLYWDGSAMAGTPSTLTAGDVDLTSTNWVMFAAMNGTALFDGDVEFLWFDDTYVDISSSTNRDKWLAENIGADGSGPTGSAPLVYATGDAAAWNDAGGINLGTGGAFVQQGAVTDA